MPFETINGIQLYYEVHGEGTPLIFVCGCTLHSGCWKPFIDPFLKHFQVILFDNRGSGQTEAPPEDYSIELFAQDTIGLMDALNIPDAHFFGESMGTCICQQICIDHPDRVRKVVLSAPFSILPSISKNHGTQLLKLMASGVSKEELFRLNASWLLSNTLMEQEGALDAFVHEFMQDPYPQTAEGLYGQAYALFHVDLRKELSKIPHEILLLVGEEDILTPLYGAQMMLEKLPNAKMHTFKKRGHMLNYEIPEQTAKKSLDFFLNN